MVSTTSLESVTGRGETSREDAKDGRAAIILLTNWTMNVLAASIFPFSRYLYAQKKFSFGAIHSKLEGTNGRVPRRARFPGIPPTVDQSTIICARRRALSLFPDARRCGSAVSYPPSIQGKQYLSDQVDVLWGGMRYLCKAIRRCSDEDLDHQ